MATAPIGPLAWEPPYAAGVALKRPKKKKIAQSFIEQFLENLLCIRTGARTGHTQPRLSWNLHSHDGDKHIDKSVIHRLSDCRFLTDAMWKEIRCSDR